MTLNSRNDGWFYLAFFVVLILVTSLSLVFAKPAHGEGSGRVTVIWSPHPDDETLRLSSYTLMAKERGDILILVAVTNGGASAIKNKLGVTTEELEDLRTAEQHAAWYYLSGGMPIIYLDLPDGQVTKEAVSRGYDIVKQETALYELPVEHYVAAADTDEHPDHLVVAETVRDRAQRDGVPVRWSAAPGVPTIGTHYVAKDQIAAESAHLAYRRIGMASVPALFDALHKSKHASVIISPPFSISAWLDKWRKKPAWRWP